MTHRLPIAVQWVWRLAIADWLVRCVTGALAVGSHSWSRDCTAIGEFRLQTVVIAWSNSLPTIFVWIHFPLLHRVRPTTGGLSRSCLSSIDQFAPVHFRRLQVRILIDSPWHSGRTSVSGRRTFPVLRLTCSLWVTTNVGKPSATGQPTRPTQPFILSGSINE